MVRPTLADRLAHMLEAIEQIEAKLRHSEISWRRLADIGNRIRHAYHAIDGGIVWEIATRDLPTLKATVMALRQSDDAGN